MSKTLNRSKSMKLTRSPRSQQSTPGIHSRPVANEEPSSRETRASGAHAENRPNTSGGTHRNRAALQQPNSGKAPPSPTVFWAAEVHSNQGAFSAPLEKAASQTANVLNWPLPAAPVQTTPSSRTQSPCNAEKREGVEDQAKGKVKRWKSLRGFFGGKKSPNEDASRLTPPFGDFSGLQSPAVAPNRLQATPTVTTRAWSDQQEKVPAKLNKDKPLPIVDPTQRTAPMPPTNHLRHQGFHGGHKYQGGTTTKPLIDVEIPPTEMERYSVMFGSLLRSNTQPNLLARRQGRGTRVNPLQVDAPKESEASMPHLKPEIATPRTQARYQLSLFPPPSPRSATLNPLRMHQPRALQRSQTTPSPHSPSIVRPSYQLSVSSNTLSQEVPLLLEVTTESAYLTPAPGPAFAIKTPERTPEIIVPRIPPNAEVMLLTPTPSTATSSRFSFALDEHDVDIHVTGPLRPVSTSNEPVWEMITPSKTDSAATSPSSSARAKFDRSTSAATTATTATSMTSYSGSQVAEVPSQVQVSVARQMSVTRAKSTKKYLEPKPTVLGNGKSSERLVDKKPLTPTLIELKNRKSQAVQIEGY